jgi:hypothetical protein
VETIAVTQQVHQMDYLVTLDTFVELHPLQKRQMEKFHKHMV